MKYGPLHAITDGITVACAVDLHLRVTQKGVTHHRGTTPLQSFHWGDMTGVELRLPTSRFPHPGALATAGYALLTLLSQQVESPDYEESTIMITLNDGSTQRLPVNHPVGGYWKPAAVNAEALLRQLIKHPERRGLLAHSEQIIHRYANATRWRRRTLPRQ